MWSLHAFSGLKEVIKISGFQWLQCVSASFTLISKTSSWSREGIFREWQFSLVFGLVQPVGLCPRLSLLCRLYCWKLPFQPSSQALLIILWVIQHFKTVLEKVWKQHKSRDIMKLITRYLPQSLKIINRFVNLVLPSLFDYIFPYSNLKQITFIIPFYQ